MELQTTEIDMNKNINELIQEFTNKIKTAAETAIDYKKRNSKKRTLSWWTKKCNEVVKQNHKAYNKYKKHNTVENLIELKKTRAVAKRVIKDSKKETWKNYVTQINKDTPMKEVWDKVRRLKGQQTSSPTSALIIENTIITDPQDISNQLALTFYKNSSN